MIIPPQSIKSQRQSNFETFSSGSNNWISQIKLPSWGQSAAELLAEREHLRTFFKARVSLPRVYAGDAKSWKTY